MFLAVATIGIVSCGGEKEGEKKEKEKKMSFCECHQLMEERDAAVEEAEDREAAIEEWREKTKACNEVAMKATEDGTYDQQLEDCK